MVENPVTVRPTTPLAVRILQQNERRREIAFERTPPTNAVDKVTISSRPDREEGAATEKVAGSEKPLPKSYGFRRS